jgi:hypothetical protein
MKVCELIAELQRHDPEAEVVTEGCDCWGDTNAVRRVTSKAYTKDGRTSSSCGRIGIRPTQTTTRTRPVPDAKPNETPLEYLRRQARWRVKDAIRFRKITKGPCEVCGEAKSQAHHTDYTRPLDVRWLCRVHHSAEHRKAKRPEPTPGHCWGCGTRMEDWGRHVYCTAECGLDHRNRNANRNALSWGDRCPQTGLLSRNGLDLVGRDAPSGTRTHGLTSRVRQQTLPIPCLSPGETTGDTSNLHPKRAQSRTQSGNGTVTGEVRP